jgi:hypothetical protein
MLHRLARNTPRTRPLKRSGIAALIGRTGGCQRIKGEP